MKRSLVFLISLLALAALLSTSGLAALSQGSTGKEVSQAQERLKSWGYYDGKVDGIFGSKTYQAVVRFQRKNGLEADGVIGPKTAAALGIRLSSGGSSSSRGKASYSATIDLLARIIAAEGRGEPYKGQVAIGAVIMNRVSHPSFPNTVSGVIYQRGAFSAIDDGQFASTPVPDSCRRAAVEAYGGADPTNGCVYYYNPAKTTNRWMLSLPVYLVIGDHRFCKPQ
ncbi:MAG: spore cortex-lytic enzyme [Clostridia bacterium]|nr:spore cortex-lytic enzyme [Clostridia bacterium]